MQKEIKFLDLKPQTEQVRDKVFHNFHNIMETSSFIGGKFVDIFETNFAKFCNRKFCIGVANGTIAIELALEALELPEGSEVIVPSNTYFASFSPIIKRGLKPVFADVDPKTYNITLQTIKNNITENTSAIIAVHLYGQSCDISNICNFAKLSNIKIIEDCSQAHGAMHNGKILGSFGDIATFSFYPGKNLGAFGDAGAVVSNDENVYHKIKMLINHGQKEKYIHKLIGANNRLDNLQAAVLNEKLKFLSTNNIKRNEVANYYSEKLSVIDDIISLPQTLENNYHVWHLYVIHVENRDEFQKYLNKNGIQTGMHYPKIIPEQPSVVDNFKFNTDNFKISKKSSDTLISLPIWPYMPLSDIEYVIDTILSHY